jgi:hypothetical protein
VSNAKKWTIIVAGFLGLVLFAFGLYIIVRDVHLAGVAHSTNAWLGGIAIVLGLSLILPGQIAAALKMIKDNLGEYIPKVSVMVGGRRATDPKGVPTVTAEIKVDEKPSDEPK